MKSRILVVFCLLTAWAAWAGNLLKNGDFEQWNANRGLPSWSYNWKNIHHEPDSAVKKSGRFSLRIPPLSSGFYALVGFSGKIADFPAELTVRGWCKYEGLLVGKQHDGKNYYAPFVGIWTNLPNGANSFSIPAAEFKSGSRDWFFFERKITRAEFMKQAEACPENRKPATFSLRINLMEQPGTIWFDRLELLDPSVREGIAVVISEKVTEGEQFAAGELAKYLKKVTGLESPVLPESQYETGMSAVILGDAAQKRFGYKLENAGPEDWGFKTFGKALAISGGGERGIVYGVYEFLEKYAGCLWIDFKTEIIPENSDWTLPNVDERGRPAFARREIYTAAPADGLWRLRNKENFRAGGPPGMNVGIGSPSGCHTFSWYSKNWDWDKDAALFGVTASGRHGTQICMTHPETRRRIAGQLRKYIREDREKAKNPLNIPLIYDISQNDGASGGECFCPECRTIYDREGSYSGVNNTFIDAIAGEIRKTNPEILLRTFAYSYTQMPPKTVVAADNVIVHSCNSTLFSPLLPGSSNGKILEGWKPFAKNIAIWAYWRPYVGFEYPYVKSRKDMQDELKFCRDSGVIHYFAENEDPLRRSFFQLQHFLGLKLMQNPDRDIAPLVDRFMTAYYGKAAPVMKEYLDYLEKRCGEARNTGRSRQWCYLDPMFYKTVNELLDKAESLVKEDPESLLHVRHERIPVDGSLLSLWSDLSRKGSLPDRAQAIERYERNSIAVILSEYGANWSSRKDAVEKNLKEAANEISLYKALPVPVPEQFKGKDIIELHWKDFNPYRDHIERCLVKEPEAVCGMAFRVPAEQIDPAKHHRSAVHYLPLTFGLYDVGFRRGDASRELKAAEIPQDEKYHWYYVGETEVHPSTVIWVHWSWMMQIYLRKAAVDIVPPKVDVYISMKATGPAYVKGSKKQDNVFVDRVILVRK